MLRKLHHVKNQPELSSEEGDSHSQQDYFRKPGQDIASSGGAELIIEEHAVDEVNDDVVGRVCEDGEHLCHELYDDYREF